MKKLKVIILSLIYILSIKNNLTNKLNNSIIEYKKKNEIFIEKTTIKKLKKNYFITNKILNKKNDIYIKFFFFSIKKNNKIKLINIKKIKFNKKYIYSKKIKIKMNNYFINISKILIIIKNRNILFL